MFSIWLLRICDFDSPYLVSPYFSCLLKKSIAATPVKRRAACPKLPHTNLRAPRWTGITCAQGFLYQLFKKLSIAILILFPVLVHSQIFKKDRFVANRRAVVWTEHVEIKDMDTPIIVETLIEQLKSKAYVQLDSLQEHNVLTGFLLNPPATSLSKARFRVDILYESYIITVSAIQLEDKLIEDILLKNDGNFIEFFPERIEKMDEALVLIFGIVH